MIVSFKDWIQEYFVYGSVTGTNDVSNVGMGVRSKYQGPDATGEKDQGKPLDTADFGFESSLQKKLRNIRKLNQLRSRNV